MRENVEIPSGWEIVNLGDLVVDPKKDLVDGPFGSNLKAEEYIDSGIPVLKIQNIKANRFLDKNFNYITEEKAKFLSRHSFISGDLIITKLGYPLGLCCKVPEKFKYGIIVADLMRLRPSKMAVYDNFLIYAINCNIVQNQFKAITKGTTRPRVNLTIVRDIKIPLPPLPEQHRIVAKIEALFSSLDKGIESLKTAQQQLKVYRQAVLKWAFEGKLTNDNVIDGELPEGWKRVKLDKIAEAIDPQPSHRTPPVDPKGVPYVGIGDVNKDRGVFDFANARKVSKIVLDEHIERYSINEGDFIIGKIGTIGKPFKIPVNRFYTLSANVVLIKPYKSLCLSSYLFYLSSSNIIENQFTRGSKATTQAAFGIQKVRNLDIPIPPTLAEQHRIVSEIESRLSVCDKLEESIIHSLKKAEALRQSILKKAFEGKLVSQDPSDDPASVLLERIKAEKEKNKPEKNVKTKKVKQ